MRIFSFEKNRSSNVTSTKMSPVKIDTYKSGGAASTYLTPRNPNGEMSPDNMDGSTRPGSTKKQRMLSLQPTRK